MLQVANQGATDTNLVELMFNQDLPSLVQFQAWTGLGKTQQAVRMIVDALTTTGIYTTKPIYTSARILEVLEVLLNVRRLLVEEKGCHAQRYLSKLFIKFTKENAKEAKDIISSSTTWNREDVKFLNKILSSDDSIVTSRLNKGSIKKLVTAKAVVSTHASLPSIKLTLGNNVSNYIWICDELLYSHLSADGETIDGEGLDKLLNFTKGLKTSSRYISEFKNQALMFESELLTYSVKNGVRFIHINRDNGFHRTIIMSASKAKSEAINAIRNEEYIKIMSPKQNEVLKERGFSNISSINGIPLSDITDEALLESILNIDTSKLDLTNALVIAPQSKHTGIGTEIKLDLTGTNSYSSFNRVVLKNGFNFPKDIEAEFTKALGDKTEVVLNNIKSEMIIQSLYRCCVRKNESFDLVLCSLSAMKIFVNGWK